MESTSVEHGAAIGSGAVILGGVRIGAGALVGAGAVVTPTWPRSGVIGNPARAYVRQAAQTRRAPAGRRRHKRSRPAAAARASGLAPPRRSRAEAHRRHARARSSRVRDRCSKPSLVLLAAAKQVVLAHPVVQRLADGMADQDEPERVPRQSRIPSALVGRLDPTKRKP